jgi:hypothetical protein
MKTDCLTADLFLEAEEALRGLLAIEHRSRLPITNSDITTDAAKLEYLKKLVDRAGLNSRSECHLAAVLLEKMEHTSHTHMTLEDYAMAVLRSVAEELATQHDR